MPLNRPRKRVLAAIAGLLLLPVAGWWILVETGHIARPGKALEPPFNLSDRIVTIDVRENAEGELVATFDGWEEGQEALSAEAFFEELHRRNRDQPWIYRMLDITSLAGLLWVLFGFFAQVVFAGRMVVQWWASERAKRSVVPPVFWWMSLLGSTMLIIYFVWRKEAIGVLGQASGWAIYVRNLWFIYGRNATSPVASASDPA